MESRLLTSVDRALQGRARSNALAAVRDGKLHAAQRREAEVAMAVRPERPARCACAARG